jgi:transposase
MSAASQNPDKNGGKEWTTHRRSQVIAYHQLGWSLTKIATTFSPHMSKSTVKSIVDKFLATKTTENLPRSGRPRKLNERDLRSLSRVVLKDMESRRASLRQIKTEFKDRADVSDRTIRRRLKEMGLQSHPAVIKPFVSKRNTQKRIQWCKERLDWGEEEWGRVCWSDECSIDVAGPRRIMVWRRPGERFHPDCLQPSFQSGRQSLKLWGCFVGDRLGPLEVYPEGTCNALRYCQILEKRLLPFLEQFGKDGGIIFMEDNATIHTAKQSKAWKSEHGVASMVWPAQSADLNPMENIWQQLKLAIGDRRPRPKNKGELVVALEEEWEALKEKDRLKMLVKSMPKRIREIIKSNGMPINY